MGESSSFDERLSRLEATVEGITNDIQRLTNLVGKMADRNLEGSKTNWSVVISALSFVGFIGAILVNGLNADINRIENAVHDAVEMIADHTINGHPHTLEVKFEELKTRLNNLHTEVDKNVQSTDEVLQREMRLLDVTLQRELKLSDDLLKQETASIDRVSQMRHHEQGQAIEALHERLVLLESGQHKATAKRFTRDDGEKLSGRLERIENAIINGAP